MNFLCLIVGLLIILSVKGSARVSHRLHGQITHLGGKGRLLKSLFKLPKSSKYVSCVSDASSVDIVLNQDELKLNDVVFLKNYKLLANTTVSIVVENHLLDPKKLFYYIQVHAYLQEIILSGPSNNSGVTTTTRGTNVGQIFLHNTSDKETTFTLTNPNKKKSVSLMIALLVYEIYKTPIPGSCAPQPRPSLNTTTQWDTISTFITPARGLADDDCGSGNSSSSYEFRFIYFGKNEYSPDVYFDTITKFLVAEKALEYGEAFEGKIDPQHENRRLFSRYAGMGLFFVAILRDTSNDSYTPISYVTSVSYGCPGTVLSDEIHCDLIGECIYFSHFFCFATHQ